jgi:hypothetical protein
MNEKLYPMIIEQQKTFIDSLRSDKEFWQDIYSFLEAYTKEFNGLVNIDNKKVLR